MASRIFWIFLAGLALVGGMIMQGGGGIFSWGRDADISAKTGEAIESRVHQAVERSFDKMEVVGSDGRKIDVPPETKRALGDAVGKLVKAETHLALLRVRDASDGEIEVAKADRARGKAEVDALQERIEQQKEVTSGEADAIREQIRADVRDTVREAVRN